MIVQSIGLRLSVTSDERAFATIYEDIAFPMHTAIRISEEYNVLFRYTKYRQCLYNLFQANKPGVLPVTIGSKHTDNTNPQLPGMINYRTSQINFVIFVRNDNHQRAGRFIQSFKKGENSIISCLR